MTIFSCTLWQIGVTVSCGHVMHNPLDTNSGITCTKVLVAAPSGASRGATFFADGEHRFSSNSEPSPYESDASATELGRPDERTNLGETQREIKGNADSHLRFSRDVALVSEPVNDVKSLPFEEWRASQDFPGYEASSVGRIRDKHGLLKQALSGGRYWTVRLRSTGKREYVHAMVASAFLGPRKPGMHVDHLNANKRDNRSENLEYVTHAENIRRGAVAKLTVEQVISIRDEFAKLPRRPGRQRPTVGAASFIKTKAKVLGVSAITINRIVYRYGWKDASLSPCSAGEDTADAAGAGGAR